MKPMKYSVSVVIPNYNGLELIKKYLRGAIAATKEYDKNAEIIVVDDASFDNSPSYIKKHFPEVKLIVQSENHGFSYTVNTGIKVAKGELIVLLNTDVLPEKTFLKESVKHFDDKNVFAVSFHEDGYGWAKGFFLNGFINHEGVAADGKVHETFWVSGGSGIFRKSYLKQLGYFDDKLFSPFYWEDIDLCYRAAKRGWKLLWEPKSKVYHNHESTISKISKKKRDLIVQRNQLTFIWKNITSPILFRKHLTGLLKRIIKNVGYIRIVIASLLQINNILSERRIEKREQIVSDEAILSKFLN